MIGVDIEEIGRFEELSKKEGFLDKVLTDEEYRYWESKNRALETLAGLWCAKEAVFKAASDENDEQSLRMIEICHARDGKPYATLRGCRYEISISHCKTYAVAVACRAAEKEGK